MGLLGGVIAALNWRKRNAAPITATGAFTTSTFEGRKFFTFTGAGTFTVASTIGVDYIAIGGGGGGGWSLGSGGGAGGMVQATKFTLTPGTRAITIGNGGAGGYNLAYSGVQGNPTVFEGVASALGGGAGVSQSSGLSGRAGGCGGGGVRNNNAGGIGTQGGSGGSGTNLANSYGGGGGGGVSGNGESASSIKGGNGGVGVYYNNGTVPVLELGGGGGGSAYTTPAGTSSFGGGAGGNGTGARGGDGLLNTGGGGGGADGTADRGGNGGSGIFIISYPLFTYTPTPTPMSARYLRLKQAVGVTGYLSVSEMYVYSGGVNVASGKSVTATPVTWAGTWEATRATDNNTTTTTLVNGGGTNTTTNGFILVDLGAVYPIDSVAVINTIPAGTASYGGYPYDCGTLSNATLVVENATNTVLATFTLSAISTLQTFPTLVSTNYTTSIVNGVQYYKFLTSGSITTNEAVVMDYFAIGGGGGGGRAIGGGGGAGGLRQGFIGLGSATYDIVIGAGGAVNGNGYDTSLHTITAPGGGAGGSYVQNNGAASNGAAGGCGGGGSSGNLGTGGAGNSGYAGGSTASYLNASGGGGLTAAGGGSGSAFGGKGGAGIIFNGEEYGGGGGGGANTTAGFNGSFGGGNGATTSLGATAGSTNTGGGGGGGGFTSNGTVEGGATGGSGVFICSFFTPTSIAGCNLWLDANDPKNDGTQYTDGAVMTKWNNKSGSGGWANAIGSPLFTRMAMNGRPAITMGTGRYAQFNTTDTGTSLSAFAVATTEQSSITTPSQLMSVYKSGDPNDYTSLTSMALMYRDAYGGNNGLEMKSYRTAPVSNGVLTGLATPFLCTTMVNSLGVSGYLNGLLASTASAGLVGAFGYDRIIVGAGYPTTSPGGWWLGAVSEVITYTTTLSSYNRLRVETYLANKYSIALIGKVVTVFSYTGADQSFFVPPSITKLKVFLWGAGGQGSMNNSYNSSGGAGAYVYGDMTVLGGQNITVIVGRGADQVESRMYGGGGRAYTTSALAYGASGGGRSAIQLVAGTDYVVAGGGGGSGETQGGGAAEWNGTSQPGGTGAAGNGRGGTQTEGGNGGTTATPAGMVGIAKDGGNGTTSSYGGGGGGGYYGGGGGGYGGGGAGSSYIANLGNPGGETSANKTSAPGTGSIYYSGYIATGGIKGINTTGGNGRVVIVY